MVCYLLTHQDNLLFRDNRFASDGDVVLSDRTMSIEALITEAPPVWMPDDARAETVALVVMTQ